MRRSTLWRGIVSYYAMRFFTCCVCSWRCSLFTRPLCMRQNRGTRFLKRQRNAMWCLQLSVRGVPPEVLPLLCQPWESQSGAAGCTRNLSNYRNCSGTYAPSSLHLDIISRIKFCAFPISGTTQAPERAPQLLLVHTTSAAMQARGGLYSVAGFDGCKTGQMLQISL